MKFLSSFIKHSLEPARKSASDNSPVAQAGRKIQTEQSSEHLNQQVKTGELPDQPATITPGISVTDTRQNIEQPSSSSQSDFQHLDDTPSAYNASMDLNSDNSTLNNITDTTEPTVSTEPNESETKIIRQAPLPVHQNSGTLNKPEQVQIKQTHSQNSANKEYPSAESHISNTTDPASLSGDQLPVSTTKSEEPESVGHSTTKAISTNPITLELTAETALDMSKSELMKESEHISNIQNPVVAVPLNRELSILPSLNQTPAFSAHSTKPDTSRPAETPQVKIGNINILIDDQAATRPKAKPASTTSSPSVPFGLRGL